MMTSRRVHFRNCYILISVMGAVVFAAALALRHYIQKDWIQIIGRYTSMMAAGVLCLLLMIAVLRIVASGGVRRHIQKQKILSTIESNLMGLGAYKKNENTTYAVLPKIRIRGNEIRIGLKDIRIREKIKDSLASFSTALPNQYVTEDYYITPSGNELVILFEDISNYEQENYTMEEYKNLVRKMDTMTFHIDRKHSVSVQDYPHLLYSGMTGSGKSYAAQQLVAQAILKKWDVTVLDIKRSYGMYRDSIEYAVEPSDILAKLLEVEKEMYARLKKLESILNTNPRAIATDCGYPCKLVLIEEYISLQSAMERKQREELERVVKNIAVLARQACIHLVIVMQAAGVENINSSTRAQFTKVLLGNAQSNILTATFGSGADIPDTRVQMGKGEGLIQLDRISRVRIPRIENMEEINK